MNLVSTYNANNPSIITKGLISNWDFSNPLCFIGVSGSTIYDLMPTHNNANANIGSLAYSYNANSGGFVMGSGKFITGSNSIIKSLTNVTACSWVNYTGGSGTAGNILAVGASSNRLFQYNVSNNVNSNGYHTGVETYSQNIGEHYSSNVSSVTGWHMWSICIGNNSITYYQDGTRINQQTGVNNMAPITNGGIQIGNDYFTTYFPGTISTVAVYNRLLSDSEVLYNYNATKYRFVNI